MKLKTIKDIKNLSGKRVFLTVDFNISVSDGKVTNDTRIREALPTINFLLSKKCKIILASHLGRPAGVDHAFSLRPVVERVAVLTGRKVHLIANFWQEEALKKVEKLPQNSLIMLENIRFCEAEKTNDLEFARHLSSMADFFINDAFGSSHRVHASIVGIASFLPSFAGFLLEKEVSVLNQALEKPKRPFVVLIGGAKTPEKIAVIEKLLSIADTIALGGAIANTFLAAWGFGMGSSIVDYEMIEMARVVFWQATKKHSALLLPVDVVIGDNSRKNKPKIIDYRLVPSNVSIYDIGTETIALYSEVIAKAKTIIWNGPMGFFEDDKFSIGTQSILGAIAQSKATSIVGGGDTLVSLKSKSVLKKITHVSTGGSAMLEFLQKGTLPGIEVLKKY